MSEALTTVIGPALHIRYEGRSIDIPLTDLDVGDISTDEQVKTAAANYLSIPVNKLAAFQVDRSPDTGDLTLRPQAIFG